MSGFRTSSILGGSLVTLVLGIGSACLSTQPAQAALECDMVYTATGPLDQTYVCGKTSEVAAPPRTSVVSGKLACDSAIRIERTGYDTSWVCQNPLATVNRAAPVSREPAKPAGVDPDTVGTWEIQLAGGPWVLEVFGNGTYSFHSEAQDGVASNAGTFSASNGHWSLKASNGYTDGGTYSFQSPDTWIATGYQLGTGAWRRRS
jgi:hypothetical protein